MKRIGSVTFVDIKSYMKDRMRRPMAIHFSERNFCYDFCNKRFIDRRTLKDQRIRMHLGGRKTVHGEPLKCTICRKEFKMIMNVKEHMQRVRKVKRFITAEELLNFK